MKWLCRLLRCPGSQDAAKPVATEPVPDEQPKGEVVKVKPQPVEIWRGTLMFKDFITEKMEPVDVRVYSAPEVKVMRRMQDDLGGDTWKTVGPPREPSVYSPYPREKSGPDLWSLAVGTAMRDLVQEVQADV